MLGAIGDKSVSQGAVLSFTTQGSDADVPANLLSFSLDSGAPSGATISSAGAFSWTPAQDQALGVYPVTIRVTDNGVPPKDAAETILISVVEPTLTAELINLTNTWHYDENGANLGTAWKETAFNDALWPLGAALLYNETNALPAPKSTLLSLTNQSGQHVITYYFRTRFVLAAEPTGAVLTVSNLIDDGAVFYLNGVEAGRYNMPTGPVVNTTLAGSTINNATDFVVSNLSTASLVAGENLLAVEVHQASLTSSDIVFGLSLSATLRSPVSIQITEEPTSLSVTAGSLAEFNVGVSGEVPQYQWFRNGMPIIGANQASYAMANAQETDEGTYSVVVSNLASSVSSRDVMLIVNPLPNTQPVLNPIGNQTVNEGSALAFTAKAVDLDVPANVLTFSLDPGAPSAATITTAGAFTWMPTEADGPGNYPVTVRVRDDGSPVLSAFETITITVNEVNTAPTLGPIGNRTVSSGSEVSFTVEATDPDLPRQTLTFSLDSGAPAGASIDSMIGLFTWMAPAGASATNSFTVRVTDSSSSPLSAFETFTIVSTSIRTSLSIAVTTDGVVVLTWGTIPGKTYRLSYSENLGSGPWVALGADKKATGEIEISTDQIGSNRQRFYRVEQLD